jgi:TonB family protein
MPALDRESAGLFGGGEPVVYRSCPQEVHMEAGMTKCPALGGAVMVILAVCSAPDSGPPQARATRFSVPCGERTAKQIIIPTRRVDPHYPPAAASQRIQGFVVLRITLSPNGAVGDAAVIESQPPGIFDSTALEAIRLWRFCPPSETALPYPDPHEVKLAFKLNR